MSSEFHANQQAALFTAPCHTNQSTILYKDTPKSSSVPSATRQNHCTAGLVKILSLV